MENSLKDNEKIFYKQKNNNKRTNFELNKTLKKAMNFALTSRISRMQKAHIQNKILFHKNAHLKLRKRSWRANNQPVSLPPQSDALEIG